VFSAVTRASRLLGRGDNPSWRDRPLTRHQDDNLMVALEFARLTALMERTSGSPGVKIGLIDGPVFIQHPDLAREHISEISGNNSATCTQVRSTACLHGTFVAGILSAKRNSPAPAICPNCTLLIRPIFAETTKGREQVPSTTPQELAAAIIECIDAGARVINLSLALAQPSTKGEQALDEALSQALGRGVIVAAAAGNQGTLGSSAIIRHPWVIPVVACDCRGRPTNESNLGSSIGRRGLCAPGDGITSLSADGQPLTLGGTSVAVPFVTGATALLWSEFPSASAAQIKLAVMQASTPRRASVVPPLLDAARAYQILLTANARR
jgi:subtilisin family serine protease